MSAARIAALTKPALDPGEITRSTAAMHTCHDRLVRSGIDPAQYNPLTAAQDVTDLMYALKVKRANFVAFQDVDIEVFDILRRFPGAVRSLTLDNPPPPGTTDLTDLTGDFSGAFNRYVALCNADAICAKAYPDLRRTWQAAFSDIATRPQVVPAANPNDENAPPVSVLLDGTRGADGLAIALTDPQTYALIPAAIAQTTGESAAASEAVRADYPAPGEPWGAEASFGCAYDVRTLDRQAQALEGRTLPQFVRSNLAWPQWCSVWPVPDISAALSQPIVSDVPVLMFRGDINPDGNPSWIPTIERGMSNAQSVIFRSLGRDLLSNGPPCLSALRRQFLADPAAKLDTAACAAKSPAIEFVAPS
jgi:pimeloyl-ACP methyl ester carboxylesterase